MRENSVSYNSRFKNSVLNNELKKRIKTLPQNKLVFKYLIIYALVALSQGGFSAGIR